MKDDCRISESRKAAYSFGLVMTVAGGLCCFGAIVYAMLSVATGRFPNAVMVFFPFLVGMGLFIGGALLRSIGARGIAGSGLKLDPEEAREDLKPWSRMAGGMLKDAGIDLGRENSAPAPTPAPEPDFEEKLRKLHRLHAEGILTDQEYADQKAAVLASMKK